MQLVVPSAVRKAVRAATITLVHNRVSNFAPDKIYQ